VTSYDGAVGGGMLAQPGHIRLGPLWYRLATDAKGGPLYRQRPAPFYPAQVSQGDMTEAQVSPDGRLPFSLRDLSEGGGLAQQPLLTELKRFDRCGDNEGEGVDATLTPGGPVILAGRLEVPTIGGFVPDGPLAGVLWHGGWADAYLSMGRYVFRYDGVSVSSVGDLGPGVRATDAITSFLGTGDVAGTEAWYQPVGYGAPLRVSTDGGAGWVNAGTSGGLTGGVQSIVEADGECVVAMRSPRLGDAMVACFDNGTTTPSLFSVIDPVGDAAVPITRLVVFNGRILVIKDREGLYLLTNDRRSLEEELFSELRGERLYAGGVTVWRGLLWLPTGAGVYAVGPGLGIQKVGPVEGETSALAPRAPRGPVTALSGDAHNLYAFRENPGGPSWIYKANVEVGGGSVREIAWFPWSQQLDRARCRTMAHVAPGPLGEPGEGADAAAHRLVFDRQQQPGTGSPPPPAVAYTLGAYGMPGQGRDPRVDPQYRYALAGTLYYARLQARFPAIFKAWYTLTPLCAPLDRRLDGVTATTAQSVRLRWKLDLDLPALAYPYGYTEGSVQRQGAGQTERLDPPKYGRGFDVGLRLATTDATTTPQVYSVTLEYDLRPVPIWRHEMTLDLGAGAYSASGQQGYGDPLPPSQALRTLRGLAGMAGQVELVDAWGLAYAVSVPVDGVSLRAASGAEAGYSGEVPLLVDLVALEQLARPQGTWRSVSRYTWRTVATMPWGALPALG
jgi:hypothetical protein